MYLSSHKYDLSILAERGLFVISHGKSLCDNIGGAVKRNVAKQSLQRYFNIIKS